MARANQPTAAAVLDLIGQLPPDESLILAAALAEVANFYGKYGGPMMDTDGEPVYRFVHQFQLALAKAKDSYLARAGATKDQGTIGVIGHLLDSYLRAAGDASRRTRKPIPEVAAETLQIVAWREAKLTWEEIGRRLHITPGAARKRLREFQRRTN